MKPFLICLTILVCVFLYFLISISCSVWKSYSFYSHSAHRSIFPASYPPPESVNCQTEQPRHWPSSARRVLQGQCWPGAEEDQGGQQPGVNSDHCTHWRPACHLWVTPWLSPTGKSLTPRLHFFFSIFTSLKLSPLYNSYVPGVGPGYRQRKCLAPERG